MEILLIQIKKMGSLVDYFPGNNFYSYCVKKIRKREKKQVIYYVIIGDKVFMFHVKHCFPQSKKMYIIRMILPVCFT